MGRTSQKAGAGHEARLAQLHALYAAQGLAHVTRTPEAAYKAPKRKAFVSTLAAVGPGGALLTQAGRQLGLDLDNVTTIKR